MSHATCSFHKDGAKDGGCIRCSDTNCELHKLIKDAVMGGFFKEISDNDIATISIFKGNSEYHTDIIIARADGYVIRAMVGGYLINPAFWKAVGKTRGWNKQECLSTSRRMGWNSTPFAKQHLFIEQLNAGLSIEEALSKIK